MNTYKQFETSVNDQRDYLDALGQLQNPLPAKVSLYEKIGKAAINVIETIQNTFREGREADEELLALEGRRQLTMREIVTLGERGVSTVVYPFKRVRPR